MAIKHREGDEGQRLALVIRRGSAISGGHTLG